MKRKILSSLLLMVFAMGFNQSQAYHQNNAEVATNFEINKDFPPLKSFITNFYEKQKESYSKKWPGVFVLNWTNDTSLDGADIELHMVDNSQVVYYFHMTGPGGGGDFGNIYEGDYNITVTRNDSNFYDFTAGTDYWAPGYTVSGTGTLNLYNVHLSSNNPVVSMW